MSDILIEKAREIFPNAQIIYTETQYNINLGRGWMKMGNNINECLKWIDSHNVPPIMLSMWAAQTGNNYF